VAPFCFVFTKERIMNIHFRKATVWYSALFISGMSLFMACSSAQAGLLDVITDVAGDAAEGVVDAAAAQDGAALSGGSAT
jgi:hypothetical protein